MTLSTKRPRRQRAASTSSAGSDDFAPSSSSSPPPKTTKAPSKKAKSAAPASSSKFLHIFSPSSTAPISPAALPTRTHPPSYHLPLLSLPEHRANIRSLLQWFSTVSSKRDMPWRASFLSSSTFASPTDLRTARKKRAYQVWISEIMLQQTRVETVKSYWLNWMSKWPTIDDLASAPEDQVLAAWRGLGYYSRATRIHTAAKKVVADPGMDGLLPEHPADLEKNVPGVGPYTAGAISSIVFGQPVPILDGNVARVLSRQLGLYANPKSKQTTDLLWAAADILVKKAYEVAGEEREEKGEIPGEWNQALMELGSTVCTPLKPGCDACPIREGCRAYAEAEADIKKGKTKKEEVVGIADMEDLCKLCEPFPFEEEEEATCKRTAGEGEAKAAVKKMRQATLSFAFTPSTAVAKTKTKSGSDADVTGTAAAMEKHIRKFPMKLEKKRIRQEECLVCIIQREGEEYLLEQRPSSGLLASMWQFPSLTISTTAAASADDKKENLFPSTPLPRIINTFVDSLIDTDSAAERKMDKVGSITHIFSHLHLTMHVYHISLSCNVTIETNGDAKSKSSKKREQDAGDAAAEAEQSGGAEKNKNFGSKMGGKAPRRWASAHEVEAETMGTGMRNCWLALQTHQSTSMAESASKAIRKGKK